MGDDDRPRYYQLPPLHDGHGVSYCYLKPSTRLKLFKRSFQAPPPRRRIGDKAHQIHECSDGKGLGMFATKDIDTQELIMSERPLSLQYQIDYSSRYEWKSNLGVSRFSEFLERLVHTEMGEREKAAYLNLLDGPAKKTGKRTVFGIWNTNSFSTTEPDDQGNVE